MFYLTAVKSVSNYFLIKRKKWAISDNQFKMLAEQISTEAQSSDKWRYVKPSPDSIDHMTILLEVTWQTKINKQLSNFPDQNIEAFIHKISSLIVWKQ